MNEIKNDNNTVLRNICLIILTLAASLFLQVLCGIVFSAAAGMTAVIRFSGLGITEADKLQEMVYQFILENSIWSTVFYHFVGIAVFGLIYRKMTKDYPRMKKASAFTVRSVAGIILAGLGLEFFVTAGVAAVSYVLPEVISSFDKQMEAAGLDVVTLGSALAAMVLAPIGEELLCRGVIFRLARKTSKSFWIANSIQALTFGVMHFNLVQGVYAFLIGLALGFLYEKFKSLYAPIVAHFVINTAAMLLVPVVLGPLPETFVSCILVMAAALLVTVAGMALIVRQG